MVIADPASSPSIIAVTLVSSGAFSPSMVTISLDWWSGSWLPQRRRRKRHHPPTQPPGPAPKNLSLFIKASRAL